MSVQGLEDGEHGAVQAVGGLVEDEEDAGAAAQQLAHSLYPAPPLAFRRFTRDNLARLQVLKAAEQQDASSGSFNWSNTDPDARIARQREVLQAEADRRSEAKKRQLDGEDADRTGDEGGREESAKDAKPLHKPVSLVPPPTWDVLLTMSPPNVEWIEEDGHYTCFGEQWPVNETLPTLEEMGMPQIYPHDQLASSEQEGVGELHLDRSAVLATLLRTMLKSYLELVDVLLAPPQEYLAKEENPSDGQVIHEEWRFTSRDKAREINDISINFMHLLNETRPLQAREQLRDLMREQLKRRREEASLIRSQCAAIRLEIEKTRERMEREAEALQVNGVDK